MTATNNTDKRIRACDISERDGVASGAIRVEGRPGYALETAWDIRAFRYPLDPMNPTHLIRRTAGSHLTYTEAMITQEDINAVAGTWRTMEDLVAALKTRDMEIVPIKK